MTDVWPQNAVEAALPEITRLVRTRIAEILDCPPEQIDLTDRVIELPGMESAKLVEVVVWCERRWGTSLDEEALFDVRTGEDLCLLIADAVTAQNPAA
jgi:acyl carrier protein